MKNYNPKEYWEKRLKDHFDLIGVGHASFNEIYNKYLYNLKISALQTILNKYSISVRNKLVLDIGCGTGFFIDYYTKLNAKQIVGIDITEQSIIILRKKYPTYTFEVIDIGDNYIPINKQFDIVNVFDVLYHITDDERFETAIYNISALCSKNGYILITDIFSKRDIVPALHVHFRSEHKYKNLLSLNNVEILDIFPVFYLRHY